MYTYMKWPDRQTGTWVHTSIHTCMCARIHTDTLTRAHTHTHADRALGVYAQMPRCVSSYIAILQPRRCRFIKVAQRDFVSIQDFLQWPARCSDCGEAWFPKMIQTKIEARKNMSSQKHSRKNKNV